MAPVKLPTVQIVVMTHRPYAMPADPLYMPLQIGAAGQPDLGFWRDDTGNNLSSLNPYYSELTGLYWAWQNLSADYVGLVHYRRYFAGRANFVANGKRHKILSRDEVTALLKTADVILPRQRYYGESLYRHYAHTTYIEPLNLTGEIIRTRYPTYAGEFEQLKHRQRAHMLNLLVMKKDLLDQYCTWLFAILGELQKRLDVTQYNPFHARLFGRIGELLLDVWLRTNRIKYREVKIVNLEPVNYPRKLGYYLRSRLTGRKYQASC